jgi:starch synthase
MVFAPDIIHVHDWHTALVPLLLKTAYAWDKLFAKTQTVLTIHNIAYQGVIAADRLIDLGIGPGSSKLDPADLYAGNINFLKTGAIHADLLTTVSPTYAREIQSSDLGMGLQSVLNKRRNALTGILNGVDYTTWDPVADPLIPHKYSLGRLAGKRKNKIRLIDDLGLNVAPDTPLIGVVSRLAEQKGVDLMIKTLPTILKTRSAALVVLGNGQPEYEKFFRNLQDRFSDRCCFYNGYNERLAHLIEAGSDMFLMPSRFEPCGLNQMYSLRYGTVPIVRQTGGLADTVEHYDAASGSGTGIVFKDYDAGGLTWALNTALDLYADKKAWKKLINNGMQQDFSWDRQGQLYVDVYRKLVSKIKRR